MSFLTKLLALLVSLLSIFLCGVVVVFVTNTNNWKQAYEQQKSLTNAAQVYALQRDQAMRDLQARQQTLRDKMDQSIKTLENQNAELLVLWQQEANAKTAAVSRADTAVKVSDALSNLIDNMRKTNNFLQQRLEQAHNDKQVAETRVVELNQELNRERVMVSQLESIRKRNEEKIQALEGQVIELGEKLQQVSMVSAEPRKLTDQVTIAAPQAGGVPIRGEIVAVRGDRASISVGSSSGVRENMEFQIYRSGQFLGNLVVLQVEPAQAAGRLSRQQGPIVKGDKVSTGFD
ncbi:MAG: hypothetical protein JW810_08995 [Sedimentisphaerales bacterium]|nr:hypothetical protein [Sedimentisphaerales bacterium]